jgi:Protein of unknown function (DUF2917)
MHRPLNLQRDEQGLMLDGARTLRIRRAGALTVRSSAVWLTVDGEAKDRVLQAGEQLALRPGHRLVVEPWFRGEAARLQWQPALPAGRAFNAPAATACDPPAGRTGVPAG